MSQRRESDGRFGRRDGSAPEVELPNPRVLAGQLRSLGLQLEREVPGLMIGTGVPSDARSFELRCIALQDADQGKGLGTTVMKRLTDFADERGLAMRLTPSDIYGGDVERLHVFYARHGFVPFDDEQLIREPRSETTDDPPQKRTSRQEKSGFLPPLPADCRDDVANAGECEHSDDDA